MAFWRNSKDKWGLIARVLHWTVALLIVAMIWFGWEAEATKGRDQSYALIHIHFQIGIFLTALMLLRLLWRIGNAAPHDNPAMPGWQVRLKNLTHLLLYALLLLMPVAGYIVYVHMQADMRVLSAFTVPTLFTPQYEDESLRAYAWYAHIYGSWLLMGLIALHISAAAWHLLVKRDGVLRRML